MAADLDRCNKPSCATLHGKPFQGRTHDRFNPRGQGHSRPFASRRSRVSVGTSTGGWGAAAVADAGRAAAGSWDQQPLPRMLPGPAPRLPPAVAGRALYAPGPVTARPQAESVAVAIAVRRRTAAAALRPLRSAGAISTCAQQLPAVLHLRVLPATLAVLLRLSTQLRRRQPPLLVLVAVVSRHPGLSWLAVLALLLLALLVW